MMTSFEDVQKINQANIETATKLFGEWTQGWQAIATEWQDYSKRTYAESTQAFEQLLAVKSVEQAVDIQTGFAKRAYEDYVREVSKVGSMYTELAKVAAKPLEKALKAGR
jgi:hypothetical protein